jgi:hypothetical protein
MRKCCCCHCSRYFLKEKRATSTLSSQIKLKKTSWVSPCSPHTTHLLYPPIALSYWNVSSRMVIQTLWWKWLDDERFSSVSATESVEHFQYMFSHLRVENPSHTFIFLKLPAGTLFRKFFKKVLMLNSWRTWSRETVIWRNSNLWDAQIYCCKSHLVVYFRMENKLSSTTAWLCQYANRLLAIWELAIQRHWALYTPNLYNHCTEVV